MDEPVLKHVNAFQQRCKHSKFQVDISLNTVECGICGEKLNPMWVLQKLCADEARAWQQLRRLEELVEENKKKLRTKCNHCGKMTKIYRN